MQTIFSGHNRDLSNILFQRSGYLSKQGFGFVPRRLALLVEEECSRFAFRQSETDFQPSNPSQNR